MSFKKIKKMCKKIKQNKNRSRNKNTTIKLKYY